MHLILQILKLLSIVGIISSGLLFSTSSFDSKNEFVIYLETLSKYKFHLFIASIIFAIIGWGIDMILAPPKNQEPFNLILNVDGSLTQKATLSGFDEELQDIAEEYKEKSKTYFKAGEIDFEAERYRDAISNYKKSIETLPTISAYLNLGASLFYISDYHDAQNAYNSGLQIAREKNKKNYIGPLTANISKIYILTGKSSVALQYLMEALNIYKEEGNKQGEASTLMHLGILNHYLNNPEEALNYYKKSSAIAEDIGFREISVANLTNIALVYSEFLEKPKEALKYHQKALDANKEMGDKQGEAISLGNIGLIYAKFFEKPTDALTYFKNAQTINEEIGSKKGIASDTGNIGFAYQRLGKPEEALKYHQKALETNKQIGFKKGEAINLSNMGINYDNLGKHKEALKYHQKALEINKDIGFKKGEATDLANIGVAYLNLKDAEKALLFLNKSLAINKKMGYRRSEAIDLSNIGAVHEMFLKKPLEAFKFFVDAISINREIGNKSAELSNLINIGVIYRGYQDYAKALKTFEEAILLADEISSTMDVSDVRKDIKEIKKKISEASL